MADNKSFTIGMGAKLDDSFSKAVSSMMKEFGQLSKEMQKLSNMQKSFQSPDIQKAMNTLQESGVKSLTEGYKKVNAELEKASREFNRQNAEVESLLSKGEKITEQEKERLETAKKLSSEKEKEVRSLAQAVGQQKELMDRSGGGGTGRGAGQDGTGGPLMSGLQKMMAGIAMQSIIRGGLNTYGSIISGERMALGSQAKVASSLAQPYANVMQGRGAEDMFWLKERKTAMDMATKEQDKERNLDTAKIIGSALVGVLGAGLMASGGGSLGGMALGMGAGITGAFSNLTSAETLSKMGISNSNYYESLQSQRGMEKFDANAQALRALDPRKNLASQAWYEGGQSSKNFELQRQLGLSGEELEGGRGLRSVDTTIGKDVYKSYLMERDKTSKGAIRKQQDVRVSQNLIDSLSKLNIDENSSMDIVKALTPDQSQQKKSWLSTQLESGKGLAGEEDISKMIGGILKAGGTTKAAREFSGEASYYSNVLGQDNVGQVIGGMSGAGVTNAMDAYKKILTVAVQNGFDLSKGGKELEKFTQVTAELVQQSGGNVDIANMLGKLISGTDAASVQAGAGQFARSNQISGKTGGLEGQIGLVEMFKGSSLNKLPLDVKMELNSLDNEFITPGNPEIQALAKMAGISPEEFAKEALRIKGAKQNVMPQAKRSAQRLFDLRNQLGDEEYKKQMDTSGSKVQTEVLRYKSAIKASGQEVDDTPQGFRSIGLGATESIKGAGVQSWRTAGTPLLGNQSNESDPFGISEQIQAIQESKGGATLKQKESEVIGDKAKAATISEFAGQFEKAAAGITEQSVALNRSLSDLVTAAGKGATVISDYSAALNNLMILQGGGLPNNKNSTSPKNLYNPKDSQ